MLEALFLSILLLFITDGLSASFQAPPKTSNIELSILRQTRNASDSLLKAELARSKAAARIFGGKKVVGFIPRRDFLGSREFELQRLLGLKPATDSLLLALELKKQFSRPRPELDEFIALCYWETGSIEKAVKLSNELLSRHESINLRQKLFKTELNRGSYEIAKHHLKHSGLNRTSHLKSLIHFFYLRSGLYVFLFWLFSLAALIALAIKLFLRYFSFEKFYRIVFHGQKIQTTTGIHLSEPPAVSQKLPGEENQIKTPEVIINPDSTVTPGEQPDASVIINPATNRLQKFQDLVTGKMFRVIGVSSQKESFNRLALSLKLAASFSRSEFQTLIIDANSSKPYIHEIKSCRSSPGLSDCCSQPFEIETFCQKTSNANLRILARGSQVLPLSILQPQQWNSLLQACQKSFDIIIINFPGIISLKDHPETLKPVEILVVDGQADPEIEIYKSLETETELFFWNRKG